MRCIRTSAFLVALAALSLAPACSSGGGDDDDDDGVDATTGSIDANPSAPDAEAADPPDANQSTTSMIGDACTYDENNPQGDCSEGFICIGLQGGSGTWCTKQCTGVDDAVCQAGYTGDGYPLCALTIQGGAGGDITACIIVCADNTGSNLCTTCTWNSCPTPLTCTDTGNNWSGCI
jgi:hypothetical protein